MLWEVQVTNHTHTNVFWQGVHKYSHGAPMCLSATFTWDTWAERHSHSNKHTHTTNHSTIDTLNPSLWSDGAVYSKKTKLLRDDFFGEWTVFQSDVAIVKVTMVIRRLEDRLIYVSRLVAIIIQGLSGTQIISTTCLSISQQNILSHFFLCM